MLARGGLTDSSEARDMHAQQQVFWPDRYQERIVRFRDERGNWQAALMLETF